jgi:hypothetical protein
VLDFRMARKKSADRVPRLIVPKNATLKQIYAIARKQFSAADLQRFTELDDDSTITTEQILRDCEAIHAKIMSKRKAK